MRAPFVAALLVALAGPVALVSQTPPSSGRGAGPGPFIPDFNRQLQQQAETDKTWRAASDGVMQMEKITYRSKVGDLDVPAFVFQPLRGRGAKGHPASSGCTRTSADISTSTTSRTFAKPRAKATS